MLRAWYGGEGLMVVVVVGGGGEGEELTDSFFFLVQMFKVYECVFLLAWLSKNGRDRGGRSRESGRSCW